MATVGNEAIERVKVREVACIFHSRDALAAAVGALLLAGFDRAGIDVIVGGSLAREWLGGVHVPVEELPEVPAVPRQPFFTRDDFIEVLALAFAIVIFIGAAFAGWAVIASGGSSLVGRVRRGRRRRGSCRYRGVDRAGLRPQACQRARSPTGCARPRIVCSCSIARARGESTRYPDRPRGRSGSAARDTNRKAIGALALALAAGRPVARR